MAKDGKPEMKLHHDSLLCVGINIWRAIGVPISTLHMFSVLILKLKSDIYINVCKDGFFSE